MSRLLFRVLPIYYSFLSGAFVSISANLFTGIYGSDSPPAKINILLLSAGLALLSSLLWIVVAIIADDARGTKINLLNTGLPLGEAEGTVIATFGSRALVALVGALVLAALSLAVLIRQPRGADKIDSQTQTESKISSEASGSQPDGAVAKAASQSSAPLAAGSSARTSSLAASR